MDGESTRSNMREIWKTIPGFPTCYEVSNLGRVRSYRHKRQKTRLIKPKLLNPVKRGARLGKKYFCVQLTLVEGKRKLKWISVGRLVLLAFKGEPPKGHEVAHNNGNKFDNRLSNLRWATPVSNAADKLKHGTHIHGSKTKTAKLVESQVLEIRQLYRDEPFSQYELANKFNVSQKTICNIVNNKSWNFIGVD